MKNPKPPHVMIEKGCCNQPKHHMNNQYPSLRATTIAKRVILVKDRYSLIP